MTSDLEGMKSNTNGAMVSGAVLGFLGAALDFYSAYLLLGQGNAPINDMGVMVARSSAAAWGIGVGALGAAVLVTSFAILTKIGAQRMTAVGALMIVFGIAMLLVGGSMYVGAAPIMQGSTPVGVGMIATGVLMAGNGMVMQRGRRMT